MARPTKQGVDYFPLDCQFDDKTEMYIIETGSKGLAVLVTAWQMIYSNNGYYIVNNDDLHLLIKRKIDVGINEVSDSLNVGLRRNLFNKDLHERYGILTSKAIQKRYFDAAKKKKSVGVFSEYLLICVKSYKNLVYSSLNEVNGDGNSTKEKEEVKEEVKEKSIKKEKRTNQLDFSSWPSMPSKETLSDYKKLRSTKKAPLTQTVINSMGVQLKELSLQNIDVDTALTIACDRGWQGLKAEWVINYLNSNGGGYAANKENHSNQSNHARVTQRLQEQIRSTG